MTVPWSHEEDERGAKGEWARGRQMGFEGEGRGDAMKGRGGDEREDERLRGSGKWR